MVKLFAHIPLPAPEPAIGEEAEAMAERLVLVAMESAGMPGRAA